MAKLSQFSLLNPLGTQVVLFAKPTDTHQFVDATSYHCDHCKKGIPYSQALRVNKIYSDDENSDKWCNDFEQRKSFQQKIDNKADIRNFQTFQNLSPQEKKVP